MDSPRKTTLAVAGAMGYIGLAACRFLAAHFRVGLTRQRESAPETPGVA